LLLGANYYIGVYLVNAQPLIFLTLCREVRLQTPTLDYFVRERGGGQFLSKKFWKSFGVPKQSCKVLILKLINQIEEEARKTLKQSKNLRLLFQEVCKALDLLWDLKEAANKLRF
jgi:hypothetical protein